MSAIHFPGITFNEADGQILLVSQPVQGRAAMDAATLHQLLVQEGYGDCRLDAEAIASAAMPPSIAATRFSSTSLVGFMMRV